MTHCVLLLLVLVLVLPLPGRSQSPDLRKPAGKEWATIGGDWNNSRYSTLATGQPLIGIDEKPVEQDPRAFSSPTQPHPRGGAQGYASIAIAHEEC